MMSINADFDSVDVQGGPVIAVCGTVKRGPKGAIGRKVRIYLTLTQAKKVLEVAELNQKRLDESNRRVEEINRRNSEGED
jgi:hypothetical protein